MDRRTFVLASGAAVVAAAQNNNAVTRYVRFRSGSKIAYGTLEGDTIRELRGDIFTGSPASARHNLSDVKLLYPYEPSKVLAVGLNYKSHLGKRTPPSRPEIFFKAITALQNPGDPIVIPPDAKNVHYEGELVIV
ncbi:MAG: fumarylacetoacetate hydrolase family protein, partial [Bryobacteraceae bacterium]